MLQEQIVPIDFGQGVDTKTDPKLVVMGKYLLLENAVFTTAKRATKRNGYTALPTTIAGGGNLVAPKMGKSFNGEFVVQDQGNLYGYSPSLQAWVYKGPYTSVEITESFLYKEYSVSGHVDCAVLGNYALYVWSTSHLQGTISTMASIVDLTTGAAVYGPAVVSTMTAPSNDTFTSVPRAVVLAGTTFAVTYVDAAEAFLVSRTFSISGSTITLSGTENQIQALGGSLFVPTVLPVDLVGTATGAVIAFQFGGFTRVKTLNASGVVVNTASVALTTSGNIYPVSIAVDSGTGNFWVYWGDDSSGAPNTSMVRYVILSSSLATVLSATTISALTNLHGLSNLVVIPTSSSTQKLLAGIIYQDPGSSQTIDSTLSINVPSNGSSFGSIFIYAAGVFPYSRIFTASGRTYSVFCYRGPTNQVLALQNQQPTFFVIDLQTASVVARFASGIAKSDSTLLTRYMPSVAAVSATKVIFSCGIEFQFLTTQTLVSGLVGAASIMIDFGSARAYRATYSGQILALNGGIVSMYDGQESVELGFHLAPEIVAAVSATGGSMAAATYTYIAVFQWTDAQGNLHESLPSNAFAVVVGSASSKVTLTLTMAYLTAKSNVAIAIYRNQGTTSGTLYTLVTDPVAVQLNATGNYFLSFVDSKSDAQILSAQELYTSGSVTENSPPPPSMILESRINRLWMVDSENPNTLWYTKSFNPGTGISPSALMTYQVDPKLGNVAGLSEMDDKMVIFKDQGLFVFAGDGVTDTGTGGNLTAPQIVPSDGGCSSLKSILLTPNGVYYKSQKGIYLLDRSLHTHYVGADVEKYNGQSVTAATMLASVNQIRFLTDSGVTLVFDYTSGQWTTFTNHQGVSADITQGVYTYVRTDGSVFQEDLSGRYLDGSTSYRVRAQLSWLALAGIQGFQRVRRAALLGDFAGAAGHGIQISAAYDFVATFAAAVQYLFSGSSGPFQYRERLPIQKCNSLTLLIEEITTGAAGEYIDLTNLSLEVGIKRGLNKLSAANSVG